jgi:hypothetical protein
MDVSNWRTNDKQNAPDELKEMPKALVICFYLKESASWTRYLIPGFSWANERDSNDGQNSKLE